jgi:hypothetical protein
MKFLNKMFSEILVSYGRWYVYDNILGYSSM